MVLRIETTNITSGREFSIYAHSSTIPMVSMYAFDPTDKSHIELEYTHALDGILHTFSSIAPKLYDGFLLVVVGNQRVVKRIGLPLTTFVVGYKPNYTIAYKSYTKNGTIKDSGDLIPIVDGFYYTSIDSTIVMVETLKKKILINQNPTKINYEAVIGDVELSSVTLPTIELQDITLPNIELQDITLPTIELDDTIPIATIEEI